MAAFVIGYGLTSGRVERIPFLTGPIVFVGFGLLMGSEGFGVLDLGLDDAGVEVLAEATLGLLLFSDAVRIDVMRLRHEFSLPLRMLALGLPVAIGLGTALAAIILDVPGPIAALIAGVLAPTDAALGQSVVTSPEVPARVRQGLNVESGLNDGIALPAVTVFIALAVEDQDFSSATSWIRFAAEQIGYGALFGVAVGCAAGLAISAGSRVGWMDGVYRQLSVLGVAAVAFAVATSVGGNGFIAVFVAGLGFGSVARDVCPHVEEFTEDLAQLLAMVSFIVFGALVVGPSLGEVDARVLLYAVASLVVVRPVAIAISLLGARLRWQTIVFFGWFGPRGLASILFGIIALEEAHEADLGPMFVVMSWTVLLSVILHGVTADPAAAAYGRWWRAHEDRTMPEAMPAEEQRVKFGGRRTRGWIRR